MNDNKDFENKTTSIHTLESDLASAVRDENYGKNIIKIVTDSNNKTDFSRDVENSEENIGIKDVFTKKNLVIFFIVIVVLGAAGTMLYILNKAKNVGAAEDKIDTVATTTETNTPITNTQIIKNSDVLNPEIIQSSDFSKMNRFEIIAEIEKIRVLLISKKIEPGNNIGVNTNLNITQFLEKIRYSGNESFLRALDNTYAFGLYSLKDNKFETYLLVKVNNFDLAFKSILDWEKYMGVDLKSIFIGNNELVADISQATTTATTTQNEKKYGKKNTVGFVDRILKNYDIREYVKNEDNTYIIYGFINNKYLLLTSGESSFIDIKDRLLKENILR